MVRAFRALEFDAFFIVATAATATTTTALAVGFFLGVGADRGDHFGNGFTIDIFGALQAQIRRNQRIVVGQQHVHTVLGFQFRQRRAFVVEDVQRDRRRHMHRQLGGAMVGAFFVDGAQHHQRGGLGGTANAGAAAMGAGLGRRFDEARTQPLARHFQQAERTDATHLDACPVVFQSIFHAPFDLGVVAADFHVDEVNDDQTGQVAQTQLAS